MGETPFFLVYWDEAVIPLRNHHGLPRVQVYDEATQDQLRCDDTDLIDK
jgi:hypothetical protein